MPDPAPKAIVATTELQQSIFNNPPTIPLPIAPTAPSAAPLGQKRRRDEEEDEAEDSDGDVAMDEDSDDE